MKTICEPCGTHLRTEERRGPAATYCSGRCRARAFRARKREAASTVPIPQCMRSRDRWVRFDSAKRPYTIHGWLASVRNPKTWTTYSRAAASEVGEGVGFVLGDGIGCIDLDDCIDERGRLAPYADRLVARFRDSAILIEKSRSGRGVHIFVRMEETKGRKIRIPGQKIEIYSWGRYIAVTGTKV